jgi:hypothetical protein
MDAVPDPTRLGLLNVRFVLSEFDLAVSGLEFRDQIGETRVYENVHAVGPAWVQAPDAPLGTGFLQPAELEWSPNRRVLKAEGPGWLVLSEALDESSYWHVKVDGEQASLLEGSLLKVVLLERGVHVVEMVYRPTPLFLGLGLFGVTVLLVGMVWRRWDG